jgi:hypothetical protein
VTTALNLAIAVIINLATVAAVLAVLAWQEHAAAIHQRQRAEEHWCWAELHRTEADAARARLHVLERRYATLQALHAEKTRLLLARNYAIIEAHVMARRNAKN